MGFGPLILATEVFVISCDRFAISDADAFILCKQAQGGRTMRKRVAKVGSEVALDAVRVTRSETRRGGVKMRRTLEGGGLILAPKVAPRRVGLLTPKLAILYRISVERGQFLRPLEIQNSHPPL